MTQAQAPTAPSPFAPDLPTFMVAQKVCGVLISAKRLNRFIRWLEINEDGCWIFNGPKTHNGYGSFGTGGRGGKNLRAHRVAYELWIGEVPIGLQILHQCDVRNCCNPKHLKAGTPKDNSTDMYTKGRERNIGCPKWTEETRGVALALRQEGMTLANIAAAVDMSLNTVHLFLKENG